MKSKRSTPMKPIKVISLARLAALAMVLNAHASQRESRGKDRNELAARSEEQAHPDAAALLAQGVDTRRVGEGTGGERVK